MDETRTFLLLFYGGVFGFAFVFLCLWSAFLGDDWRWWRSSRHER